MIQLYQLHPISVHFPIAFLSTGFVLRVFSKYGTNNEFISKASRLFLWIGSIGSWIAAGLGLLAEKTVPHNPAAWEELAEHKELGLWTAGLFAALVIWDKFFPKRADVIFTVAWAIALGVLIITASHGGELVYEFGLGVGTP